jgi:hypothetical protein
VSFVYPVLACQGILAAGVHLVEHKLQSSSCFELDT